METIIEKKKHQEKRKNLKLSTLQKARIKLIQKENKTRHPKSGKGL